MAADPFWAALKWIHKQWPELSRDADPLLYQFQVAALAGRPANTVQQWRWRSHAQPVDERKMRNGKEVRPFPTPDEKHAVVVSANKTLQRFPLSEIVDWLVATDRWQHSPACSERRAAA